jgi:hypothetical protein
MFAELAVRAQGFAPTAFPHTPGGCLQILANAGAAKNGPMRELGRLGGGLIGVSGRIRESRLRIADRPPSGMGRNSRIGRTVTVPPPFPPIRPMFRRALNVRRWGGKTGRVYYSCNLNKSSLHSLPFQYSARPWAGPRAPNLRSFCANLAPLPPFYQQGGAGGRDRYRSCRVLLQ